MSHCDEDSDQEICADELSDFSYDLVILKVKITKKATMMTLFHVLESSSEELFLAVLKQFLMKKQMNDRLTILQSLKSFWVILG